MYTVNMFYSHRLLKKPIWPIGRHNKARQESQKIQRIRRAESGAASHLPKEQDMLKDK